MLGLVERPYRAARRFNRAIRSSSKLRTCRFPSHPALHEIIDLNDLHIAPCRSKSAVGLPINSSATPCPWSGGNSTSKESRGVVSWGQHVGKPGLWIDVVRNQAWRW